MPLPLPHAAALVGDCERLSALLAGQHVEAFNADVIGDDEEEEGSDGGLTLHQEATLLHCACKGGHLGASKWLVECQRASVRRADIMGTTALHHACASGSEALVRWLVCERRADANARMDDGRTPLQVACRYGHLAIAQWLVGERRASPEEFGGSWGASPSPQLVRWLVEDQGVLRCPKRGRAIGREALRVACLHGNWPAMMFPLESDAAAPVFVGGDRWPYVTLSVASGFNNIARWLLQDHQAFVEASWGRFEEGERGVLLHRVGGDRRCWLLDEHASAHLLRLLLRHRYVFSFSDHCRGADFAEALLSVSTEEAALASL